MNPEDEIKLVIKEAYKNMLEIVKLNEPEVYLMPTSLYNQIMKKIIHLERALDQARESNKHWRQMYKVRNDDAKDYEKYIIELEKRLKLR